MTTTVTPTPPASAPPGRVLRRWLTADFVPDPDQPRRRFDEAALDELAASMTELGQQVPVIAYPDPTTDRRLVVVDGERRWRAALRAMIQELDVIVLSAKPTPTDLLLAQVSVNQCREALTPAEQERVFRTLMREMNLTQADLAQKVGVSPSKVSKVLARGRITPELLPKADELEPAVLPLIAALPPADQADAVAFAATPDASGRKPTRDEVKRHLDAKAAKPRPGPKAKAVTLTVGGRAVRLAVTPQDTHEQLADWLKAVSAFVLKNRNVPVANLNLVAG
jgi:ParB family chromosome partitioning protein